MGIEGDESEVSLEAKRIRRGEEVMKVLLAQLSPILGDKAANLRMMEKAIRKVKADLALFGELFLTGYMARDHLTRLAEDLDGSSVRRMRAVARAVGTHVIFGMPERGGELGHMYNSAILISPDDEVHCYRKVYPANFGPFEEATYFGRGTEVRAVETSLGKIGLMICYDTFFPELAKIYAMQGADILAIPSAAPHTSIPLFHKVLPARAVESTAFVFYANIVGTELNMVLKGGSVAFGPRGDQLAQARDFQEDFVVFDCDTKDVSVAREFRPTVRDTRSDILRMLGEVRWPRGELKVRK